MFFGLKDIPENTALIMLLQKLGLDETRPATPEVVVEMLAQSSDPDLAIGFLGIQRTTGFFTREQLFQIMGAAILPHADAGIAQRTLTTSDQILVGALSQPPREMPAVVVELFRIIANSGDERQIQLAQHVHGIYYLPDDLQKVFGEFMPLIEAV